MTHQLIPENAATDTRPSMGDPEAVDALVRGLAAEISDALFAAPEGSNPQIAMIHLAEKYRDLFFAGNPDFQQTMTPEAQAIWLQQHDVGTYETDPRQIAGCLAVATIKRVSSAMVAHAEQQIDDGQLQFRLETAIEDCVATLLGIENPAD